MLTNTVSSVLITGASGRIGSVLLAHFLREGRQVIFSSRSEAGVNSVLQQFPDDAKSGMLIGFESDLSKPGAVGSLLEKICFNDLSVNALINNARDILNLTMNIDGVPSREKWMAEYLLDVVVPYELSMAVASSSKCRLTAVVNISSIYGVVAANPSLYSIPQIESPIHYNVAKAAVVHLTKELAIRLAPKGIRVNTVSYGGVSGRASVDFKERYAVLCPSERMLEDRDLSAPIDFLLSEGASGVTGHNLLVDGGWTAW